MLGLRNADLNDCCEDGGSNNQRAVRFSMGHSRSHGNMILSESVNNRPLELQGGGHDVA